MRGVNESLKAFSCSASKARPVPREAAVAGVWVKEDFEC
jgi:hypothetical protein